MVISQRRCKVFAGILTGAQVIREDLSDQIQCIITAVKQSLLDREGNWRR